MYNRVILFYIICIFIFAVQAPCNVAKNFGSMTDSRDGQIYKTVRIGSQTWMAENLNYETSKKIVTHQISGKRGKKVREIKSTIKTSFCHDDLLSNCLRYGRLYTWYAANEACPTGWHLPDSTDWNVLFDAVGGKGLAGKALKSTAGWYNGGNGSDKYGFSAQPIELGPASKNEKLSNGYASFWSSSEVSVYLSYYSNGAMFGVDYHGAKRPIRCVEGELKNGNEKTMSSATSSSSAFSSSSSEVLVTKGTMTDSRDGHVYKTITIGSKIWMAENLNYKISNSYCFGDDKKNCNKYGRLYTWASTMDSASSNHEHGVCPAGWHLPTLFEWEGLISAAGGKFLAGKRLKSVTGWFGEGTGAAVDDFGFSAIPSGFRYSDGSYSREESYALFWSTFDDDATNNPRGLLFSYYSPEIKTIRESSDFGLSVRCAKDIARGTLVDYRDGQTYKTVKIGSQNWMAENLRFKSPNSFCYNNADSNCVKYGRLYLWSAALDSVRLYKNDDEDCGYCKPCPPKYPLRGVCPAGWHLPTETEWQTLFDAVKERSTLGDALKSKSGWEKCDYGHHFLRITCKSGGNGHDYFGFNAVPAGFWSNGLGEELGKKALFWSSTGYYKSAPDIMELRADKDYANLSYCTGTEYEKSGLSVRCVQDEEENSISGLSSSSVNTINTSSSVIPALNGNFLVDFRDGQTYRTVTIGEQTWMAENLKYKTDFSTCHRDIDSCAKYGRLYEWGEAMNACPTDWHLPTEEEWNTLFNTVGGKATAANVLKSKSGWIKNGNGTDEYEFSALPAGRSDYYDEIFGKPNVHNGVGEKAYFWSVSMNPSFSNALVVIEGNDKRASYVLSSNRDAISVRCLKNKPSQSKDSSTVLPSSVVKDSITDPRDGQVYKTVKIGPQTWMAQNLNYETEESDCYNSDYRNCPKYGRFYNWDDAMKACPTGWHLPDMAEWNTLFESVGGRLTASQRLKSTSGWKTCKNWCWANGNGSDDYGFNAIPVKGWHDKHKFGSVGEYAEFWTSSEWDHSPYYIYLKALYSYTVSSNRNHNYYGRSVRCVKDSD